jgi:biopolymer transport protein TolR
MAQTLPKKARGRRLVGEINVVPYIDVMLVLLIIFMITAPLLTQGVKVDLPKAGAEAMEPSKSDPLVLSVDRDGRMFVSIGSNKDKPVDEATVVARTAAVLRRNPQTQVMVKADRNVAYGKVISAMVLLQRAGAEKVGFITDPLDAPARTANPGRSN